jgi:hypothetical protein
MCKGVWVSSWYCCWKALDEGDLEKFRLKSAKIIIQKIDFESKISWVTSSHLGQRHMLL